MSALTAEAVKAYARERGADDVGVAGLDRFEGAPPHMDPRNLWPEARSLVVIVKRIPRGTYRGIEEGTHWNNYTFYSYNRLNTVFRPRVTYETACFVEDRGWEAMPLYPGVSERYPNAPKIGPVAPNVDPHFRICAVAAGLGEIGWSKVFIHPRFGPRVRIGALLTDAELTPDPVREPSICDRCRRCVAGCPGAAIPKDLDDSVSIEIDGVKIEWGDVHMGRCTLTHHGLNRDASPFLAKDAPHLAVDMKHAHFTEEEAYRLTHAVAGAAWPSTREFPTHGALIEYYRLIRSHVSYFAVCGAKGCIRECMINLEDKARITNVFKNPFRKRPAWKVPSVTPECSPEALVPNPAWDGAD